MDPASSRAVQWSLATRYKMDASTSGEVGKFHAVGKGHALGSSYTDEEKETIQQSGKGAVKKSQQQSMQARVFSAALQGDTESELAMVSPQLIPDVLFHTSAHELGYYTPLTVAARYGNLQAVRVLLYYQDKYCVGDLKLTSDTNTLEAILMAVTNGHLDVVYILLQNDEDLNKVNRLGETALHMLCRCVTDVGRVVEFLTSRGAKLDIADAGGETCLFIACREGREDLVRLLLAKGADPNHRSSSQSTPLHAAAARPDCGVARLLVQHGARLSQDGSGYTPLVWAALRKSEECVEYFLTLPEISKEEKIEALELLGGMISGFRPPSTYSYWKRAMDERYGDPADIIPKPQRPPVPDLGNVVESQTPEELESRQHDWHRLRVEGLLVLERILGEDHKEVALHCEYICWDLLLKHRFGESLTVWMYSRRNSIFVEELSLLDRFIRFIFFRMQQKGFLPTFAQYHDVLHLAVQEMEVQARAAVQDRDYLCCATINVRECVTYIRKALPLASSDGDLNQLQDVTGRLIRVAPQFHPMPVIHIALDLAYNQLCSRLEDSDGTASFLSLVAFLAKCGADVSGKKEENDTPLHRIGKLRSYPKFACSMARLLLEAGADVDARNGQNQTPLDTARSEDMRAVLLEHYPLSLKCLAASVIVQRGVRYQGLVPSAVERFIRIHKSC